MDKPRNPIKKFYDKILILIVALNLQHGDGFQMMCTGKQKLNQMKNHISIQ